MVSQAALTAMPFRSLPEDAAVAVIVHRADRQDSPATVGMQANFMAPIVINTASRQGKQVILQNQDWPVQAPLAAVAPDEAHPDAELSLDATGR